MEDNQANQQLVQFLLRRRGYHVDVASNGMLAVEAATRVRYDAILMDCQMPEMDGYEATRRIRTDRADGPPPDPDPRHDREHPRGRSRARCLEVGMDDTIGKPFQPKEMLAWLERWLLAASRGRAGSDPDLDPDPRVSPCERWRAGQGLVSVIFGESFGATECGR